jgi:heat shock protein HslJ/uncharacterized lipoprotein YbaY
MSRTLAAVLIALVFTGCATVDAPADSLPDGSAKVSVKGALTYRARIALPPDARAVVELKDTTVDDGGVVAEQRMDLSGRQVPIPFELTVDRTKLVEGKQYGVRGAFLVQGRAAWVSDAVVISPKRDVIDVGMLEMKPYTALAFASDLQCGDQKVTIGFVGNVLRLTAGDRSFDMRRVGSASDGVYEAVDDSSTTLRNKGDETMVAIQGKPYPPCKRREGATVPFRATGNEPGWRVDIGASEMALLADYGTTRIVMPTPPVERAAGSRRYAGKSGGTDLTVTVFDRPCVDTMSGMPHPMTVVVLFEGRTLNGCGGDPADLLKGGEWVVEDVTGVPPVDGPRITLDFGPAGQLSGSASCNRYGAEYTLSGEGLTIAKGFTSMMACDPKLLDQERTFLEVLGRVRRFDMGPNGTLILHTDDRRTITARRS